MSRLRIRIELSRGGMGVPLRKLASVIGEADKFLHLLGEDVRIGHGRGEWLGFEFDSESLNFTAEYVGPVTPQQVEAFNAAFDGTTSLRRDTIAQFARIADGIGEDEIIGFGLFPSDQGDEPEEWRCLSRRDALRILDGIQALTEAREESGPEARLSAVHLPPVQDPDLGARLFGERRERHADVETNLSRRLTLVEGRVEQHSGLIQDLRERSATTETSFRNLLSSVENFCEQATRQIERASPAVLPAAPAPPPEAQRTAVPSAEAPLAAAPRAAAEPVLPRVSLIERYQGSLIAVSAALAILIVLAGVWLWPSRTPPTAAQEKAPVIVAPPPAAPNPAPNPAPSLAPKPPAAPARSMRVDLEATAPAWVSFIDEDGGRMMAQLLEPGAPRSFQLTKSATLRTGNAGGLTVLVNGKPVGPLGPPGQVREIQFKDGAFKIASPIKAADKAAP